MCPSEDGMESAIGKLLDEMCVDWGFCIDPESASNIRRSRTLKADEFACAVLKAEGMDCAVELQWRRKIRNRFIEAFGEEVVENEFKNAF